MPNACMHEVALSRSGESEPLHEGVVDRDGHARVGSLATVWLIQRLVGEQVGEFCFMDGTDTATEVRICCSIGWSWGGGRLAEYLDQPIGDLLRSRPVLPCCAACEDDQCG